MKRLDVFSIRKCLDFLKLLSVSAIGKPRWGAFVLKAYFHENYMDLFFLKNVLIKYLKKKNRFAEIASLGLSFININVISVTEKQQEDLIKVYIRECCKKETTKIEELFFQVFAILQSERQLREPKLKNGQVIYCRVIQCNARHLDK